MFSPISSLLILTITAAFSPVVADLKWGTFLGADWEKGEERLRSSVATSIKNSQIICSHDVSSLCFEGRSVNADSDAVSLWTEKHYKRKQYTHFDEVRRWPTVSIIYSFLWLTQNLCLLLVRFVDLR